MIELRLVNLEDVAEEFRAITGLPADENGFNNEFVGISFEDFVAHGVTRLIANHHGEQLPSGYVPYSVYFLWDDDKIVGVFHFRHYLNEALRRCGGHIGYAILPEYRGQGYATKGLELLLAEIRDKVIEDEIYIDAHKDNLASQRVALKNGAYVDHEDDDTVYMRIPK